MKRNVFKHWIAILLPLMIILVLLFFLTALSNLDKGNALEEKEQLEAALHKSTVSCYSIEGAYPPSLEYLIENYGIQINTKRFTVKYEYCASNMMPDITVLEYPYENSH